MVPALYLTDRAALRPSFWPSGQCWVKPPKDFHLALLLLLHLDQHPARPELCGLLVSISHLSFLSASASSFLKQGEK